MNSTDIDKRFPIEREFSTTLLATAEYVQKPCDKANREYLWCRMHNDNPAKCLTEGVATIQCATDV